MCVASAYAGELPVQAPAPSTVQAPQPAPPPVQVEVPKERGVKWRMGDYGELDIKPEIIKVDSSRSMRSAVMKSGGNIPKGGSQKGYSILRRRDGQWSATVYVVDDVDYDKTLEHEMHHVRGFIHD